MRARALAGSLLVLLAAERAAADLVVFEDGRAVKAASWHLGTDTIEIELPGGGSFTAELARVDRIVEDEVVAKEEMARELPPLPPVAYDLSYHAERRPLLASPWDALIDREAKRQNLDAALVSAVIRVESHGDSRSVSRKGARGLMQLMPATARRLKLRWPFDPAQNIRAGVQYLKELAERFENRPEFVLAAYNAGEGAVESFGGVPPYRETIGYVKRVLSWWTPLTSGGGAEPESEKSRR